MEEFRLAHNKMIEENKKYLIVILLESLDMDALPRDLQMYLRTYTYIDATKVPRDYTVYAMKLINSIKINLMKLIL